MLTVGGPDSVMNSSFKKYHVPIKKKKIQGFPAMKMIELVVLQPFHRKDDSRTCESTASTHTRTDV